MGGVGIYAKFQSTRPVRGATSTWQHHAQDQLISIHAPRAGRDFGITDKLTMSEISIHAPRAGRDPCFAVFVSPLQISIHAPRAGRDHILKRPVRHQCYFNPRAPCGARPEPRREPHFYYTFQSTRPVRGATGGRRGSWCSPNDFNPRAPCGARPGGGPSEAYPWHFNPRAPCGARLDLVNTLELPKSISIHAPRAGRDLVC